MSLSASRSARTFRSKPARPAPSPPDRRLIATIKGTALGFGLSVSLLTSAHAAVWRGSWAASPALPLASGPGVPEGFASPMINNQTVVQIIRLSAGGQRLRLRLSNEFGKTALKLGHVRIALLDTANRELAGTAREVTFGGAGSAVIPPAAPMVSDPIDLKAPALASLKVSMFLPGDPGPCTCHAVGAQLAELSPPGDFTGSPFTPVATTQARAFLSEVDVESYERAPVVAAFGDSITDGYLSTTGANHRWPDRLQERLVARGEGATAVVNTGIGGNRVLSDGVIPIFGVAALARLDRDVLAIPGLSHIIMLEGINDIGGRPAPSAQALIFGFRQVIARAHAHGVKVILATILPYGGAGYFRTDGEVVRQAVNAWIRTQRDADGMVDFDAALRDPAEPTRMRKELQSGDWLHPNDAGYRVMGDAVPTNILH